MTGMGESDPPIRGSSLRKRIPSRNRAESRGEDFARFLQQYPGAYYWLGTAIPEREVQKPLHDPSFDINEEALLYGVELMTANALNGLAHLNKEKERLQNG